MAKFESNNHRNFRNDRHDHNDHHYNNHRRPQQETPSVTVEEGQRFPLTIKRMGINGEGIGYYKRMAVFIPGALTGEEVVAEVTSVAKRFLRAKIHRIRKTSPHRVEPRDSYADEVGVRPRK